LIVFTFLTKFNRALFILDLLAKQTKSQTNRSLSGSDGSNPTRDVGVIEEIRQARRAFGVSYLANLLGLTPKTVYRFLQIGLPHFKLGATIRLDPKATVMWLEQCWMG
jgi:hypothetical protein